MRSGSLTPREWLDWVLDQYGMTLEQVVASAKSPGSLGGSALSLICNVLEPRFGQSLTAEILTHHISEGGPVSRHMVIHRLDPGHRAKHGVTDDAVAYHRSLLVPPPHTIKGEETAP